MRIRCLRILSLMLLTVSPWVPSAFGTPVPAVISFSTTSFALSADNPAAVIGWRFTPSAGISVTALGWWDRYPSDPLGVTHDVGIWTDSGTLLASTTILTNSHLTGEFRYEPITPLTLTTGQVYRIAGVRPLGNPAHYAVVNVSTGSVTAAPEIQNIGFAGLGNVPGLVFPSTTVPDVIARIGPNFLFETPVPEPSTLLPVGLGLCAVVLRLSRRRS